MRSALVEHTTTGHIGTLRYRARELVNTAGSASEEEPGVITTASDIYAVGCISLEVRLPFSFLIPLLSQPH
jgi:serine/threonine protein kinase